MAAWNISADTTLSPFTWEAIACAESSENTTHNVSSLGGPSCELPRAFQVLDVVMRLLEGLLAVSANGLTILAFIQYDFLRTNNNLLICSLAAADLIGGLSPVLLLVHYILRSDVDKWLVFCTAELFLNVFSAGVNILSVMLVSVDRFLCISFPLRYHTMVLEQYVCAAVGFSWAFVLIQLIILTLLGVTANKGLLCRTQIVFDSKSFLSWSTNLQFALTSFVNLVLYSRVAYIAWKQARRINNEQNDGAENGAWISKRENKITKMMAMVLGVYFASYIPQVVVLVAVREFEKTPLWLAMAERCGAWIWWINSWMNPIIYGWNSREFNRAYRLLLGLKIQPSTPA